MLNWWFHFAGQLKKDAKVVNLMEEFGLKRGVHQLEIYVMAEIPSNVIQAADFANVFDGFPSDRMILRN